MHPHLLSSMDDLHCIFGGKGYRVRSQDRQMNEFFFLFFNFSLSPLFLLARKMLVCTLYGIHLGVALEFEKT
jgi:hypothetical protein